MSRTLAFAVLVLGLALAEFIHPFGPRILRISPGLLVILALLLAAAPCRASGETEARGDP